MTLITVKLKTRMADGPFTFYSLGQLVQANTPAARSSLLNAAYDLARARGFNVNTCFHSFETA